jgi:hypothetical protein
LHPIATVGLTFKEIALTSVSAVQPKRFERIYRRNYSKLMEDRRV